ncbi:M48 family metallopeptidase [Methylocystis sp. MJC1]|uniref:M48 family metallopeptidase n=1 Tax=Methylocystis sp. MJC1 TaxID=2654282 RepID=UPI0013E9BEBA|nr:M48 family metallopeptidase [Methylocystis sp. MJC1]KAF2991296.1 Metalloprotease LoiP [Methylocystis sp. MJC1]MBU6526164.1 M48 family metallopeptidase [Methylocystis sp. MJC1]UZX12618.1 M48 family metallopeptidase [Methylocystis sp. MJC1]
MTTEATGNASYFDGSIERRRAVQLVFGPALEITEDGVLLAAWPYADVRRVPPPGGVMRLMALGGPKGARLEVDDPQTQTDVVRHCLLLLGERETPNPEGRKRLIYGLAASVMLGAFLWGGVPRTADLIAPAIPVAWEKKLGAGADEEARKTFPGKSCQTPKGMEALQKVSRRLEAAAHLRLPATIEVLSSKTPNAFALPGGKIYLLSGLLDKAWSQDEVIGVLAHELGHLEHRDHLRRIIETGGTAMLVGLVFGDVTEASAMVVVGNSLFNAAHSRENEAQADAFAAKTLGALGRPAKPMGELLVRITGEDDGGPLSILHDHPLSADRLEALEAADKGETATPLLSDEEWAALKGICG